MSNSDLKAQVSSGVFWSGGARVAQQGIQFGLSVVLARLLSPGDYGLMAMVMVFTGFAGMLADAGFNAALVQKQDLTETHVHTVFWVTLAAGGLLAGITFLLSPWLSVFFDAPALDLIFKFASLNFILGAIGNVPSALLQKEMRFRAIAKIDTASILISGVVGVILAWRGFGVWSLVVQSLAAAFLTSMFRCWSCRWLPRPVFSGTALKDLWRFSGHFYGFNFINYWARNADNLVVGKFFGAPALGVYNRAYALMLLPITQISSVVTQVIFPALSSIQNDKERVKRIYLRAIGILALMAFPMMFGLLVVAKPFVITFYGVKWASVAPLLQILVLVGAMQVLGNSTGWLFLSQGRTDVMFFWGTICSIIAIASFVAGVLIGSVSAVAYCYAAVNVLFLYPELNAAGRTVNIRVGEILSAVAGPLFSSLMMATVVAVLQFALPAGWQAWQQLVILVLTGMISYGAIIYTSKLQAWEEFVQIIREKRGGKFAVTA